MKPDEKRTTKLKELLENASLSQKEVSEQISVTERTINDWVRGVSYPRLDRAALLARALGVSFKTLCDAIGIPTQGIPDDNVSGEILPLAHSLTEELKSLISVLEGGTKNEGGDLNQH